MKLLLITLAFIAAAAADVSHLNNKYLPPVIESESVPQDEQAADEHVPEPSAPLTIDLPEPLVNPTPIKDAVIQHMAFAAKFGQQLAAAAGVPVEEQEDQQPEEAAAEAEAEQPIVEQVPEVESYNNEQFSQANSEYDIPALPEVSNGIDTRYGSNGGYIY